MTWRHGRLQRGQGERAEIPLEFSHMIPLMCFSTITRFVKTTQF